MLILECLFVAIQDRIFIFSFWNYIDMLICGMYLHRWAGGREDKYFARIGKNAISVYETETMGLLDKKSLKVDNVIDFCWSPTDSLLSLFVPEGGGGNQPARVNMLTAFLFNWLQLHPL